MEELENNQPEPTEEIDVEEERLSEETLEDDTDDQSADQDQDDVEESDEVELDGKTYQVPKSIKSAIMAHKDYTVKTQEVAEQRRALEAERKEWGEQTQARQQFQQDVAEIHSLDKQLKEFAQVDWNAFIDQDPIAAQKLQGQYHNLNNERNRLAAELTQKEQQFRLETQQSTAKRIEQAEAVLRKEIKEWSPELDNQLQTFAVEKFGFDADDAKSAKADPRLIKLLHLAYMGDKVINKPQVKPALKPVTTIKAKSTVANKTPDKMTPNEFAKWRKGHIKQRGRG